MNNLTYNIIEYAKKYSIDLNNKWCLNIVIDKLYYSCDDNLKKKLLEFNYNIKESV